MSKIKKITIIVSVIISAAIFFSLLSESDSTELEKTKSLELAENLKRDNPEWLNSLPDCPCMVEDARNSSDWEEDNQFAKMFILTKYHPGATTGFRSSDVFSSVNGTNHGQQCTYDEKGLLITEGPAAGTPDFWSPITNFAEHQTIDVVPWEHLGWGKYNQYWIPNGGNNCTTNSK